MKPQTINLDKDFDFLLKKFRETKISLNDVLIQMGMINETIYISDKNDKSTNAEKKFTFKELLDETMKIIPPIELKFGDNSALYFDKKMFLEAIGKRYLISNNRSEKN